MEITTEWQRLLEFHIQYKVTANANKSVSDEWCYLKNDIVTPSKLCVIAALVQ